MAATEHLSAAIHALGSLPAPPSIDAHLHTPLPRKSRTPAPSEITTSSILTPIHTFSPQWLNKLQSRWTLPEVHPFTISPTMTRTVVRFTREGLEGRVSGYKEVSVPAHASTAKNSTSLLRRPAGRGEMVRGKGGFFPFRPGGLEVGEGVVMESGGFLLEDGGMGDGVVGEDGLLQVAPGMRRGLRLPATKKKEEEGGEGEDESEGAKVEEEEKFEFGDVESIKPKSKDTASTTTTSTTTSKPQPVASEDQILDSIDDLLPVEFPMLAPPASSAATIAAASAAGAAKTREWAHMVDVDKPFANFHELVPNMAREWPFELDVFQKEAVYHLEKGDSVFVAAHTSAGKTVVAEYGIALAAKHMTKAIYTSPIKALSNQKFRDFRQVFDDVGILTGDVQINPEASCLIMTTEILRSMLYRGADIIRDVEFVIFDEVHYVNDAERGVVWEEVIIMLPEHVNLILLSATVPNTKEFASWVGRTKKKDIYVISTPKRPVPLEHYVWANKAMFKIVNAEKQFLSMGLKAANDALQNKKEVKVIAGGPPARGGGSQRGGRGDQNQRGGQRGRGGPRGGAQTTTTFTRSGRGGIRSTPGQDRNTWVHLVQHLKQENLLPAVAFVFSKRRCETNADALSNLDYCTASEKSLVHMTIEKSLARLKQEDRDLPQIRRMRELLSRGLGVHHGGLLPIVKEVVEILFARSLVKVLFATETFAMGLNLPTRTVVFSDLKKHDGQSFRELQPGEYIQMAGRAGRRGLDPFGTVIIVSPLDATQPEPTLRQIILGQPRKLQSQFRLTYNMILNLLRVEALKIEEMIKRSFGENLTQTLLPAHELEIAAKQGELSKILRAPCEICDVDLKEHHKAAMQGKELSDALLVNSLSVPVGRMSMEKGRLVVFKKELGSTRTVGVIMNASYTGVPTLQLLYLEPESNQKQPSDLVPFHIVHARGAPGLPDIPGAGDIKLREAFVPITLIECVTRTMVRFDLSASKSRPQAALAEAERVRDVLIEYSRDWTRSEFEELDYARMNRMLQYQEAVEKRKTVISQALGAVALSCENYYRHFSMYDTVARLQDTIDALKRRTSDQNLALLPNYEQRVEVLKELRFIDEEGRVELKGRVACEINSASELVLTELVLENFFAAYEPEEICALLSAFVFQEKTMVEPKVTPRLEAGKKQIILIARKVNAIQTLHGVPINSENEDFETRPRFGLMEVVYEWAKGMAFSKITELTDVLEGSIVRAITRLDEACREVKNSARIVGDPGLFGKMQRCQELIRRDVCHCASLYL